ncbi:unnamed protein product [marine sediment metagenome]|uniref:Uncharacterized protein n=1 Tax=marine sediment metagenome TaxID=412755 RepID=X0UF44_9ZZZZ
MASEQHNFIVSAIARKIRQYGFRIIYLDGKYQDVDTKKFYIPPQIINHRPDVIGEKEGIFFCIGEAKTKNDLFNERTKNQIIDFFAIVRLNYRNRLIVGIPLNAKKDLENLLLELGLEHKRQIKVIYIPEELLPHEEEI